MSDHIHMPQLGTEGDACSACHAPLAIDQRYCLQCGQRRGASRVDFAELLPAGPTALAAPAAVPATPTAGMNPATTVVAGTPQSPWTPLALIGSIATLGLMLLIGVMIGKDDSPSQITAAAPTAAPVVASTDPSAAGTDAKSAGAGAGPGADTSAGTGGSKNAVDTGKGGSGGATKVEQTAPASEAPGAQTIDEGALQALEGTTGQEAADASKNLPDTIALPGEPPPVDNEAPGGGSDAQVIK